MQPSFIWPAKRLYVELYQCFEKEYVRKTEYSLYIASKDGRLTKESTSMTAEEIEILYGRHPNLKLQHYASKQKENWLQVEKNTVDCIFDCRIRTKAKQWYWPKERYYWLARWPSRKRSVHCPMKARKVHLSRLVSIAPSIHSSSTVYYILDKNCIQDSKEPTISLHNLDTSISFEMNDSTDVLWQPQCLVRILVTLHSDFKCCKLMYPLAIKLLTKWNDKMLCRLCNFASGIVLVIIASLSAHA